MRHIFIFIAAMAVISCSSATKLADSPDFKRVEIGQKEYVKPAFFIARFAPDKAAGVLSDKANRAPASVGQGSTEDANESLSPRTVYFLGLWQQKLQMERALSLSSDVSCPAFHQDLLRARKELKQVPKGHSFDKDWAREIENGNLAANPALALPAEDGADLYTSYREGRGLGPKKVRAAFKRFYTQTKNEVRELCETGVSPGYYVYANMVRYYSKDNRFMSSAKGVEALLKLTPVANFFVLQNLKSGSVEAPRFAMFERKVLQKLNALWFESYAMRTQRSEQEPGLRASVKNGRESKL